MHLALVSTKLDGPHLSDIFSTSARGWGIISTHRWNLVRGSATDIDTYQYLLHQIGLVGLKAYRPLRGIEKPKVHDHDPFCMFDDRVKDVTTKPDSIANPKICSVHRDALDQFLGSGKAILVEQLFQQIATESSSSQISGS